VRALERARDRGQIRPDISLDAVVDQLWGACYHRLLLLDEPINEQLVDQFVDTVLRGVAPAPDHGSPAVGTT